MKYHYKLLLTCSAGLVRITANRGIFLEYHIGWGLKREIRICRDGFSGSRGQEQSERDKVHCESDLADL
jgi:hypothetical protein